MINLSTFFALTKKWSWLFYMTKKDFSGVARIISNHFTDKRCRWFSWSIEISSVFRKYLQKSYISDKLRLTCVFKLEKVRITKVLVVKCNAFFCFESSTLGKISTGVKFSCCWERLKIWLQAVS